MQATVRLSSIDSEATEFEIKIHELLNDFLRKQKDLLLQKDAVLEAIEHQKENGISRVKLILSAQVLSNIIDNNNRALLSVRDEISELFEA